MRLEPLTRDQLTTDQETLYVTLTGGIGGTGRTAITDENEVVHGPFTVMLHHPRVGHPVQKLGGVLRFKGTLADRPREIVILVVAAHWHSEFEWWAHARIGREVGLTDSQIEAVRSGAALTLDDPSEQVALDAARALVSRGDLDDDEYDRVRAVIGDEQLIEITALVGYYAMLAMQMRLFRITIPDTTEPAFS